MAEYIERERLLHRFNIDDMMNVNGTLISLNDARNIISNFPTEDVVPVVRCRDCKHRTKETRWTRAGFCGRRGAGDHFLAPPDGYCCYGEREEST